MQFVIPHGSAGDGFSLTFGEWDTPRPRFLGRADRASAVRALEKCARELPTCDLSHLAPDCYHMYRDKMDKIYGLVGLVNGQARDKRRAKRILRQKDADRMLKRAQRYLGLRQAISHMPSESEFVSFLLSEAYKTDGLSRLGDHELGCLNACAVQAKRICPPSLCRLRSIREKH